MDFIKECFEEHVDIFLQKLQGAGFSVDQARQFLPATASGIMDSIENTGIKKMMSVLSSEEPSQLPNSISVEAIAEKLVMNRDQVKTGLEAIAPVMSEIFSQKSDDLVGAAASLTWSSTREITSSVQNFLFNK